MKVFKIALLTAAALGMVTPAMADGPRVPVDVPRPNTDDGPGACPDSVSPCPTPDTPDGTPDGTPGNGGTGVGVGIGVSRSTSTSTATGGNATATGGNASSSATGGAGGSASVGNVSTGASTASSNQSQSTANANNSSVTVEGDEAQRRNPVATAYAAPLTAGVDTCMGSSTAGAQGIGFGISLGTTWTDKNCVRLKTSRELSALGLTNASIQVMCLSKDVRIAMANAGTPCEAFRKAD